MLVTILQGGKTSQAMVETEAMWVDTEFVAHILSHVRIQQGAEMIPLPNVPHEELRAAARRVRAARDDADVQRRALAAYFKSKDATEHPTGAPLMLVYSGKRYVALSNGTGLLAVYRVRNDLQLKRLRRIPLPLVAAAHLVAARGFTLEPA